MVGAGNAGLSAALAARESGASVTVAESAPVHLRGGNSYFTGGLFRFAYRDAGEVLSLVPGVSDEERRSIDLGSYPQSEYYADVMRVTGGLSDPELVQTLVSQSYPSMRWMSRIGIGWVLAYGRQAFERDGVFRFWAASSWRLSEAGRAYPTGSSTWRSVPASTSCTRLERRRSVPIGWAG